MKEMQIANDGKKEWLYEISFMRPILLLLLVSYHAFAPWCGTWDMPIGCSDYEPYRWVALISRAFRLECFVFISGYIFTFQMLAKNKFPQFKELLKSKIMRLLLPCWFFSALYYVLFKNYSEVVDFLIAILGGGRSSLVSSLPVCLLSCAMGVSKKEYQHYFRSDNPFGTCIYFICTHSFKHEQTFILHVVFLWRWFVLSV